jgi:hypothetical protein
MALRLSQPPRAPATHRAKPASRKLKEPRASAFVRKKQRKRVRMLTTVFFTNGNLYQTQTKGTA